MPTWLFRPLSPVVSHVAVAALAIAAWFFVIVPLWRKCRPRLVQLSTNKSVLTRLLDGIIVLLVFALGVWACWYKGGISAWLRSGHGQVTSAIASPSPAPTVSADSSSHDVNCSPYATAADFAKYAMKLREQGLLKVESQGFIPTNVRPAIQRYPWKTNIVTTVFWVGEKGNHRSVWDANWTSNYGGFDNPDPSARRSYLPIAFIPRQNPFYCALPYNDVTHGQFKPEAPLVIPWFKKAYTGEGQSVCWHRWIAIRKGNRTCYAQWEDCGPFRNDHFQYVFGNERPKPNANHGAGLNVSPAVRDYLGLATTDVTDWQFIEVLDVPPGPWRSYGENNHFVTARSKTEQRMADRMLQQGDQSPKK